MRRHRFILPGIGALLFLCICCGLVVGAVFSLSSRHSCSQAIGAYGSDVTVLQEQTVSNITACGGNVLVLGHVAGDVTAYGGNINLTPSGRVDGGISSYGGRVEVAGLVRGNVSSYGGGITLDDTARVFGDVKSYGGGIAQVPGAQVRGDVERDHPSGFSLSNLSLFNPPGFTFPVASIIIWMLVAAALAHWFPQRTLRVGEVMFSALPRSLAIGALSWILGLILAAILALTIIGIPLTIAIVLVLVLGGVIGNVAMGWFLGRLILQRIARGEHSPVMEAMVGVAILAVIESIPFLGAMLGIFIALLGVGATLLSRFGSRRGRSTPLRRFAA
jgi:cytoskeletal protein CcmA (bactofilin family)